MGQYQHWAYRSITMVRGGLISMLTRKTTDLSVRDVDPAASLTLMSADVERIVQGWQTMHEMWANLAEIAVAIVLLEGQLGISCLVPVGVSICKSSRVAGRIDILIVNSLPGCFDSSVELCDVASGPLARSY